MPQQQKTRKDWSAARRGAVALLAVIGLLALLIQPAQAFSLFFRVPQATVDIYINEDGTATIDYLYVFANQPGADPIDAVDIGLPTKNYDLSSASGTINGQPVSNIGKSPYIDPGIALELGSRAIPAGQTGEVRAHIGTVRRLLFKASSKESEPYGSFQFEPNFFDSQFVTGSTDMTVTLHLPTGLKPDEPRYFPPQNWPGGQDPETGFDTNGNVYYRWHSTSASASGQYIFGASFPARLVPAGVLQTELPKIDWEAFCPWIFCLGFAGFLVLSVWGGITGDRKRKLSYLPPRVAVEGHGIKRGLTAVEAAILMEQPMDKILTMILFSVIKKGAATVVSKSPMKLQIAQTLPEDLRAYETDFLTAMGRTNIKEQRQGLQDMMTNLVKGTTEKMRGFSRKETVAYYQNIMNQAWAQVEQAQTPELKMQMFDDAMDWTMLDRRFNDRTRDVFGPRPVILPGWWGRFDPGYGHYSTPGTGSGTPTISTVGQAPQGMSLPSLPGADFAGSLVTGMQTFSSNVVGDLTAFTGGVTQKTNPPPPPSTSSSRGGGGGGRSGGCACACACACAGCACACAGGGR